MLRGGKLMMVVSECDKVGSDLNLPLGSKYHNRNSKATTPVMVSAVICVDFNLLFWPLPSWHFD